ncbi:hypothetical protein ACUY1T_06545 [Billgrantia sp. Q4P2]|uniref:hypothetical protein n=1 Tax=Billgrantia sp. Q4P2 TaxID=3463857 RepID=UPI0040561D63
MRQVTPMADIASRLKAVQQDIERLAELAAADQADTARHLAESVKKELDSAIAEAAGAPAPVNATSPALPRGPRHEEIRCPLCSLRSFTYQAGTLRRSDATDSGYEALFHCLSCGHEAWHEAQ